MSDQLAFYLDTAKFRKAYGMAQADQAEDDDWKQRADEAIILLGADYPGGFTAEHVRARAGSPRRPNAMGARLSAAAKSGLIVHAGYTTGKRPESHARVLRVWRRP